MIQDNRKTWLSWAHDYIPHTLPGTLETGDYLGDTTNATGLTLPGGDITSIHYTAATASGADTVITLHNVTEGTSTSFTPSSEADNVAADLHFNPGDELAISVDAVDGTTAGDGVSVLAEFRKYRVSSTQHGE